MIITLKIKGIDEAIKKYDPQIVKRTTINCINRTLRSGKNEMSKIIREKYNIKKADLDPKISIKFANNNYLSGILQLTGEPISLMYFNPIWQRGNIKVYKRGTAVMKLKKKANYMKVKILKDVIVNLPHAFIGLDKNKLPRVFSRIRGSKSPVTGKEKLRAIKVKTYPSLFKKPELLNRLIFRIEDALQKNFRPEFYNEIMKKN